MSKRKWIIHRAKARRYEKRIYHQRHKVGKRISNKFRNKKYIKSLERGRPQLPLKKVRIWKTTYLQDKKTGMMEGRKRVKGGFGDRTSIAIDERTYRIFGRLPKAKRSFRSFFPTVGPVSTSLDKAEKRLEQKKIFHKRLSESKTAKDLPTFIKKEEYLDQLETQIQNEEYLLKKAREKLKNA